MKLLHKKLHPASFLILFILFFGTLFLIFQTMQTNTAYDIRSSAYSCMPQNMPCNTEKFGACCSSLACVKNICVSVPTVIPSPSPFPTSIPSMGRSCTVENARYCQKNSTELKCLRQNGILQWVPTNAPCTPVTSPTPTPLACRKIGEACGSGCCVGATCLSGSCVKQYGTGTICYSFSSAGTPKCEQCSKGYTIYSYDPNNSSNYAGKCN